jgi:hypothetical protein
MNRIFDPQDPIDLGEGWGEEADAVPARQAAVQAAAKQPRRLRARRPVPAPSGPALSPVPGEPGSPADGLPSALEPNPAPAPQAARRSPFAPLPSASPPVVLVAAFVCSGLVTAAGGMVALNQWNRSQESLQQERNLLLVERLRSLGPSSAAPDTPAAPILAAPLSSAAPAAGLANGANGAGGPNFAASGGLAAAGSVGADLPPPPPQEAWIEQLGDLPRPQGSPPLLRVPVSPKLAAATAEAARPRRANPPGPLPLLVGVVGSPGKPGSAIFQMGGSTATVAVGDSIGSSGWRLRSTDGDSVLIDHDGDVRRITIGSGG